MKQAFQSDAASHSVPRHGAVPRVMLIALMMASFGMGLGIDRFSATKTDAASNFQDAKEYAVLEQTWNLIQDNFVAIDDVNQSDLMYGAAAGMVDALGDTGHSRFANPEQAALENSQLEGKFVGIGVSLDYTSGQPVIEYTIQDSPAQQAGLKGGDIITEINGTKTAGLKPEDVQKLLIGKEGEQVSLTVTRPTTGESLSFDIIRAEIDAPSVTYTMLPNDVALIRISVFSTGVTNQLKSAIRAVKRAGATSLILDLRDNGGGIVFEAIGVASQFVPEGKALYLYQERDGETKTIKAVPNGLATDIPMIVLINNNSASSSEITAASIQDAGRGKLVGEATFGTGTVLTPFQLDDGSEVILGTALWLTPDGQSAWHVGLPPDIEVAMPADADQIYPNSDTNEISMATLKESTDVQLKTAFNTVTGTETFPVEK